MDSTQQFDGQRTKKGGKPHHGSGGDGSHGGRRWDGLMQERGHAVTENLGRLMLKIKEARFTEVLNKIDAAIGMEAGQTASLGKKTMMARLG